MPRVPYHDTDSTLSEEQLRVFNHIEESRGNVIGVFAVLLGSPSVAELIADLGGYMRFDSILSPLVRELTITTALSEYSCQFEWAYHEDFARQAGVSDSAIEVIKYKKALEGVSEVEAEIIQYGRELIRLKRVSDATYQAVAARYSTQEITEITALFGYYAMVACVLNAFEVPSPPGKPNLPDPQP